MANQTRTCPVCGRKLEGATWCPVCRRYNDVSLGAMSDLDELGRLARECVARADIERRHADEFNIPLPANDRENLARALLDVLPVVRAAEALRDSGHDYDCPFLTTDCLATCTVDAARFALGKAVDTLRTQLKERQ